jgi:chromosome segregation protein
MKLKKLQLSGFKSFTDKTEVRFPSGVSAIVGPNGCGKSNIVDALRWVMGEQSVKQLRGKSMEDIIFAGADGKPPVNMAEVSLTLLNDNGSAPEELRDHAEIMVTRRLYRSGESAYFLNKRPCRLKDIHNLFMGTGMGAKAYAVIQQGNIGAITEAGPDERRVFIEEAAGVTRYKTRKTEALRKVAATNQNLYRLEDIISEVQRQMRALKRQAKKAASYKKFQKRIRDLDILLALFTYDDYSQKISETEALLTDLKDKDIAHTSKLKQLDAAIEKIKLTRWQKNQEIAQIKSDQHKRQRTADKTETDLEHARQDLVRYADETRRLTTAAKDLGDNNQNMDAEIIQVKQDNEHLGVALQKARDALSKHQEASLVIRNRLTENKASHDHLKSKLMDLVAEEARYKNICLNATQNKEGLKRRLKRIDEEKAIAQKRLMTTEGQGQEATKKIESLRRKIEAVEKDTNAATKQLNDQKQVLADAVKQVQTLEYERNQIKSRYNALKKMEAGFEWYKDGVRAIMQKAQPATQAQAGQPAQGATQANHDFGPGIMGLMADIITPKASYEIAVEAALGEALQYVLVKDQETGLKAIDYLLNQDAGRSGFIPITAVKPISDGKNSVPEASRRLTNYLSISSGFETVVESLLGHVVVADDMSQALKIFNKNGVRQTIVTKNGEMVSPHGIMTGGSQEKSAAILSKKLELKGLESQLGEFEIKLASAHQKQEDSEALARRLETELQQLVANKLAYAQEAMEADKALYRATEDVKSARRHLDILSLEEEQLLGEEIDLDEQVNKYNQSVKAVEKEVQNAQAEVTQITTEIESVSAELERFNQEAVDQQLKQTSSKAKLEHNTKTLSRLNEYRQDSLKQLEQITREIVIKKKAAETTEVKIKTAETELKQLYAAIEEITKAISAGENDYQAIDDRLKQNDAVVADIHNAREKTLQKTRLLELDQSQHQIKREAVEHRINEYYHQPLNGMRNDFAEELGKLQAASAEEVNYQKENLEQLRQKLSRFNDVNLAAIKEFEELKERHDFLSQQRDDLMKAIDDLHKVIRKINRITQVKFTETFNLVNGKLKEVFPRLFEGGSAKLILTDPEKPLETGVEYMIHPPGKKLTRMSLLSGGEKALSAIAFIFSIFLIKPTSFCLMDEIDAPLDDANTFRFNDLLKLIGRKSQIIMITHNKSSMEFADTLFGITMEKKGISKVVSVNLNSAAANN